ncbi:MAG: AMMECR1 domain-containing protein [Deltaproteobacteria bacterium]|nr:AMMECR1 domain-containing protein [Deltaproteobacteria bacterium]
MADTDKLTEEQGKYLVGLARGTIERALSDQQDPEKPDADLPAIYNEERGTFVTLTIGGNLRGCIGHIIPQESLIEGIKINAIILKKLRPDIDGVIIKKGSHQATFLPQVWEQLQRKEDFLSHLCLKAGLSGDAWRMGDLKVSTYQVQAFEE